MNVYAGHDEQSVPEVHGAVLAVSQAAILKPVSEKEILQGSG